MLRAVSSKLISFVINHVFDMSMVVVTRNINFFKLVTKTFEENFEESSVRYKENAIRKTVKTIQILYATFQKKHHYGKAR